MTRGEPPEVLIAGGGTAGHVLPALAVAEALVARGRPRGSIVFVGSRRGLDASLLATAGYELRVLPGRGITRRLSLRNVAAFVALGMATISALGFVLRRRPGAVVCLGGYASLPPGLAAALGRVPILVVNLDAVPGAANRVLARMARVSATAFADSGLPRETLTGAPLRPEVLAATRTDGYRAAARARLSIPEQRRVVVVTGGSLGARTLNEAGLGLADRLRRRADLVLVHLTGERSFADVTARAGALGLDPTDGLDYRPAAFSEELPALFAVADVVVSRAGASTCAELQAIGVPAILVPLPGAPRDHQRINAERLAAGGGAIVLADAEATPTRVGDELEALLADPARLRALEEAFGGATPRDGAARIATLVEELVGGGGAPT